MAYTYAVLWGASPIILVGCDFSWPEGKVYSDATDYSGQTCAPNEDGHMVFSGKKPMHTVDYVDLEAYGGEGTVVSGNGMEAFVPWFEKAAGDFDTWNCTEGGARIPGTTEIPLEAALEKLPDKPRPTIPPPDYLPNMVEFCEDLKHRAQMAKADHGKAQEILPMINMWLVPATIAIQTEGRMLPPRIMEVVGAAINTACAEILEAL
jgi:hypothetical protein